MHDIDIFSVNEINIHIKNLLENSIPNLYVEGEISNFTRHSSGHIYFSLKDDFSTIRCVFFKQNNYSLDFFPKNGDKVILLGRISLYVKGGSYQFNVDTMYNSGKGILQIKFEQLKYKLEKEGLFDRDNKLKIPKFPKKIGVITSPTGAALQDIKNVIFRRFPIELHLYPATVQGDSASKEVVAGLKYFSEQDDIDILIIARGGGSQDDLFVFNDETIARSMFDCKIPIITGIGHEIDFTIADLVADLRAPTPSAAAEVAVPDRTDLLNELRKMKKEIHLKADSKIIRNRQFLSNNQLKLGRINVPQIVSGERIELNTLIKKYQDFGRIGDFISQKFYLLKNNFTNAVESKSTLTINSQTNIVQNLDARLKNTINNRIKNAHYEITLQSNQLESKSPMHILSKGYAYISKDKSIISKSSDLQAKDIINIRFADGEVSATVNDDDKS